jgi:hypothetical protein
LIDGGIWLVVVVDDVCECEICAPRVQTDIEESLEIFDYLEI